ncbi:Fe2+-dependent dioxygenase [Paraglaciecola mesophila]|uniref:PKHD-type hydroxylase n=2 Tax=Paraglaciecola mesophila TaxID=197222 RepID=K6ZL43_9ALTE|nr:Fe2+-dependent dioxygenase [Paraglaciecola mesophila]GAC24080.1 PKHD-type hydroxylase [Paraglaciecola mesophila KMM 241]|tara:strand:- start:7236 stop:7919 length:684 start_codon:yes stop_codon:yes gene_type:complete
MLTVIEDLLSKKEVTQFTQALDKGQWLDGKHTAGSQASKVKYNQQLDDGSALAIELRNTVIRKLSGNALFMSSALPNKIYPPKFNRYQGGEHYGLHVDASVMPIPNSHQMLRTDLSATLFLSEPKTYDGGELSIETQFGLQQIKLNAGSVILYPANSLHQVNPVTKGHRTASFFWIESLVRSNDQRSMLFDLDQSIQALTVELGNNDAEVKRLTGVYHNLMRSWASC